MSKYSGPTAAMTDQVRAVEKLEGYPKAPSFVGDGCKKLVQQDPMFGYTNFLAEIVDNAGTSDVILPDDVVAKQEGKSVTVGGKQVTVGLVARKTTQAAQSKG